MSRVLPRNLLEDVWDEVLLQARYLRGREIPWLPLQDSSGNRLERFVELVAVVMSVDHAF